MRSRRKCVMFAKMFIVVLFLFSFSGYMEKAAATITVTNLDDSGPGSLRDAIEDAFPGETINFGVTGTITLSFWHWYVFEWCSSTCGADNPVPCALDGGNVEVYDGSSWVRVTPAGGYPGTLRFFDSYYLHPLKDAPGFNADGTGSTWLEETFDVTAHASSLFQIRFVFGSDSGVGEDGWYIDDVVLTAP